MALSAPEASMLVGVAVAEALTEVVPTAVLEAVTVVLAYGTLDGATTLEVVIGLTMVQGQLVMVKVVDSETV